MLVQYKSTLFVPTCSFHPKSSCMQACEWRHIAYIKQPYVIICAKTACITYLPTYLPIYLNAYIHTYIHACIHTYIHSYIHTYIHTYKITFIHPVILPFMAVPVLVQLNTRSFSPRFGYPVQHGDKDYFWSTVQFRAASEELWCERGGTCLQHKLSPGGQEKDFPAMILGWNLTCWSKGKVDHRECQCTLFMTGLNAVELLRPVRDPRRAQGEWTCKIKGNVGKHHSSGPQQSNCAMWGIYCGDIVFSQFLIFHLGDISWSYWLAIAIEGKRTSEPRGRQTTCCSLASFLLQNWWYELSPMFGLMRVVITIQSGNSLQKNKQFQWGSAKGCHSNENCHREDLGRPLD